MGFLTVWKIITWVYNGIVNDPIFAYNYLMLIIWFFLNIMNVFSWLCIYSLYLELDDLTKIQDMAKLKVGTFHMHGQVEFFKNKKCTEYLPYLV